MHSGKRGGSAIPVIVQRDRSIARKAYAWAGRRKPKMPLTEWGTAGVGCWQMSCICGCGAPSNQLV